MKKLKRKYRRSKLRPCCFIPRKITAETGIRKWDMVKCINQNMLGYNNIYSVIGYVGGQLGFIVLRFPDNSEGFMPTHSIKKMRH